MLINDLFKIENIDKKDNVISASVTINAANQIFDGHFPNNPITPGVVQIQLAKEILELQYNKQFKLNTVGRCRFIAILNPAENPTIEVELTVSETEEGLKVNALGKNEANNYFKFSATYS